MLCLLGSKPNVECPACPFGELFNPANLQDLEIIILSHGGDYSAVCREFGRNVQQEDITNKLQELWAKDFVITPITPIGKGKEVGLDKGKQVVNEKVGVDNEKEGVNDEVTPIGKGKEVGLDKGKQVVNEKVGVDNEKEGVNDEVTPMGKGKEVGLDKGKQVVNEKVGVDNEKGGVNDEGKQIWIKNSDLTILDSQEKAVERIMVAAKSADISSTVQVDDTTAAADTASISTAQVAAITAAADTTAAVDTTATAGKRKKMFYARRIADEKWGLFSTPKSAESKTSVDTAIAKTEAILHTLDLAIAKTEVFHQHLKQQLAVLKQG